MRRVNPLTVGLAFVLVLLAAAAPTCAQAFLPLKGEGTASVILTSQLSKDHMLPEERYDFGHVLSHAMLFDVLYGVSDRLAVNVGLPVVFSRYRGDFPHRPVTLDDGAWHGTAQDLRFGVRYMLVDRALAVTPFITSTLPTHGYEYLAHAAPGRQLKELLTGVSAGYPLGRLGLVVQGQYAYTFSERPLEHAEHAEHNGPRRYSLASLEAARALTPRLRVFGVTVARIGHTGIDLYPTSGRDLPPEVFHEHDRIARESYWNVGAGTGIALSDSWDLFGSFTRTVNGRNTQAINRGLSIGVSWRFRGPGAVPALSALGNAE